MSSNQGCCKAYSPVNLSAGFILSNPLIRLSAFFERLLIYFFSNVSGFEMSGNFNPLYLGFFKKLSYYSSVS
jgi:hypothetical protein